MTELQTAAFGMNCFWGPEAVLGALEGVLRTRVGYAGGTKDKPSYRDLGDHTETVLVEYDPEKVGYGELLDVFWDNHDYSSKQKRQYQSKIFYTDDEQKQLAEESMDNHPDSRTDLQPLENFHVAEDYHQKYRLRHSPLMEEFKDMSPEEFRDSRLAAKANAAATGRLSEEDYEEYTKTLG